MDIFNFFIRTFHKFLAGHDTVDGRMMFPLNFFIQRVLKLCSSRQYESSDYIDKMTKDFWILRESKDMQLVYESNK